MHLPLVPLSQLERLSQALTDSGEDLQSILAVLIDDITAAVPTLTGLAITTTADDGPVTVAAIEPVAAHASILLPLHLISSLPGPTDLVLYAAEPGAFLDLAAETRAGYCLDEQVRVDQHLPAPRASSAAWVRVLAERSTIDQAIGVLLDEGYLLDGAREELTARAASAHLRPVEIATEILERAGNRFHRASAR